ncbi:MAG: cytochrome c family protein, partial [Desulfobulbaceae bacterium]|nr:cytochrome c family protein [Desulfobulbaceae bacterium]
MQDTKTDNCSKTSTNLIRWEVTALVAALVILTAPFIYVYVHRGDKAVPVMGDAVFAGSEKCKKCHQAAYDKWQGSHHDLAMDTATEQTVLGDFNDAVFTDPYNNFTSRFYRRDNRFYVETEGPDGKPGEFEITHTFGVYPLQQYLVPFPGGRLQCLNIAWDVEKKTWYRLPPYEVTGPDDWLHWTRGGQTWNGMCAECHSTRLTKGYDLKGNSYQTSWFEIDVGCEACHGPGSKHIAWADHPPFARLQADNYALSVQSGNLDPEKQIALCAPCHSRRFQLGDNMHGQGELLEV